MRAMILLFAFVFNADAAVKKFDFKDDGLVQVDMPKEWIEVKDLYGVPLTLMGPKKSENRPVILITPTGLTDMKFDVNKLEKNQSDYKQGREEWLKKAGGKSISYYPYKAEKWNGIEVAHAIGYRYQIEEKTFTEKSYYVICGKKFYHIKSLVESAQEKEQAPIVDSAVRSFSCGNPSAGGGKL